MMDIITGRAPPPAQAESHRSSERTALCVLYSVIFTRRICQIIYLLGFIAIFECPHGSRWGM